MSYFKLKLNPHLIKVSDRLSWQHGNYKIIVNNIRREIQNTNTAFTKILVEFGMERLSFVKDGVLRLPPGFRFHPTDEELILDYLRRKVFSFTLPASVIPEVEVCKSDPWELPGDKEHERGNQVVGMKKTLVFYRGKAPNGCRTDWIMHEYRLANVQTKANISIQAKIPIQDNWVLCRIFLKKRSTKSQEEIHLPSGICSSVSDAALGNDKPVYYDFMAKKPRMRDLNLAPAASSSGSSGVTDETSNNNGTDDHEESSSCSNSLATIRRKPLH
ncbi:hypothetical protein Leryth_016361 [Lithospermum erythrorhizon]|nr:hypothetical protein Leryth_016361 [Lithospermum erythrorhizon]